jgi:hypothetical protein
MIGRYDIIGDVHGHADILKTLLDTPFFIFINSSFEIIDIFKQVYLDDKE